MFERSDEQALFAGTTRRFLESQAPLSEVRALAGTKSGFEAGFWRQGSELGWTSLAVPEAAGGGSVSGRGIADLLLVAYEFGAHAAPGPLGPVNVVAAALGRWGGPGQRRGPLAELMAGTKVAAWVPPPFDTGDSPSVEARWADDGLVVSGSAEPVEAGAEADFLLVAASDEQAITQVLVPSDAPGLTVTPRQGLDLTRRYARIDFDGVRLPQSALVGPAGGASAAVQWLTDLAVVIQLGEMVGAMQWALNTTLEWSLSRYSFGRPLASYQEIKHRFADMKTWLEASCAITAEAATAVELDGPDRAEMVSAAKAYVGRFGPELIHDCVQLHGGIGVTFDHDLHLFLRRVTTNLPTYGCPADHELRLARIIETQEQLS